jgi:hypothetical protein
MQVNKPRGIWLLKCTKTKAERVIPNQKSLTIEILPFFYVAFSFKQLSLHKIEVIKFLSVAARLLLPTKQMNTYYVSNKPTLNMCRTTNSMHCVFLVY